ncbi:Holliday junction resolvase RuvX [Atribacter laminatus]|jgi:RNase H-fold protein (predicted Holliday junction resolvase)|uniref:Pre-16S rRNA nuclease n=1 Tax=Atribacter laminatus TaxID=2847778 RepID=A0A7T1F4E1_ATRLM|nr:Holliday junction resolvase RuvX [Atribacter laminatus]QPM69505.1 Putative pre-16S rRNA nuclease [Atribacter laminatus]
MDKVILSIDPGTEKCGIALLDQKGGVIHQAILPVDELEPSINKLSKTYSPLKVIIGNSTGRKKVVQLMKKMKMNYEFIEERLSTLEARKLYFKMNPPRGLKKLLPKGFLVPSVAIDDWSAVIIGQRYLFHNKSDGDDHDVTS